MCRACGEGCIIVAGMHRATSPTSVTATALVPALASLSSQFTSIRQCVVAAALSLFSSPHPHPTPAPPPPPHTHTDCRGQAIPLLGQLPQAEALSSDTLVQLLNAALNDPMRLNRDVVRYLCGAPSPGLFCSCGECFSPVQQAAARISADDVASLLTRALTLEGQVGMHAESTITMLSLLPGAQGMETKVVQDLLMAAVQADAGDVVGRLYGLPGARQLTRSDHAQLTSAALDVPGGCSDRLHAVLLSCSLPYDAAHASHMCQP